MYKNENVRVEKSMMDEEEDGKMEIKIQRNHR